MSKRVPAALHSELSEYSALLRALRTSSTLDLATQLTHAASTPTFEDEEDEDEQVHEGDEDELPSIASVSNETQGTGDSLRKRKRKTGPKMKTKKGRSRDTWTRWPLLAGDVHVPEWGLEDEVKLIALHVLKSQSSSAFAPAVSDADSALSASGPISNPETSAQVQASAISLSASDPEYEPVFPADECVSNPSAEDPAEDDEDELPSAALRALTTSSATHLARILALLAAHVPATEKSMQNRLHPLGWEAVLDIVGAYGLASPAAIDTVRSRMEGIYGVSQSHVAHRTQTMFLAQQCAEELSAKYELSFLTLPWWKAEPLVKKRKRGPYRKRKTAAAKEG